MKSKYFLGFLIAIFVTGCATVRQEDLDSWVGQPVSALEVHPVFLTVPVVKTRTSDGTQIWNYVNGRNISQCSNGGAIYGQFVSFAAYNSFSSCVSNFAACNNIFYIKDNTIVRYTPVGTGGIRCYTTKELQPNNFSPSNIR